MAVMTKSTIIPTNSAREIKEVKKNLEKSRHAPKHVISSLKSLPKVNVERQRYIEDRTK